MLLVGVMDVSQESVQGEEGSVIASCRRLHAAIDALDQAAADMLGVSRTDLRCLNLLEHGPMPPTRIAASLRLTSGSVTALLDRLEKKGLVERSRDPDDRRGVRVNITPAVFAKVGRLYQSCAEALSRTVGAYPAEEQNAAVRHLNDVAGVWEQAVTMSRQP